MCMYISIEMLFPKGIHTLYIFFKTFAIKGCFAVYDVECKCSAAAC